MDDGMDDLRARLRRASRKRPARDAASREPETSIAKVERDRSRKNSRAKGNRGELDVATAFSRWCGEPVRRTPGSGGWGGAREFGTKADLVCANPIFPFHVECKHREKWVLDDLVTGVRRDHDRSVVRWWEQCVTSCPSVLTKQGRRPSKVPLLAFRRNFQPWLVMVQAEHVDLRHGAFRVSTFKLANCEVPALYDEVSVMLLDEFLIREPVPAGLGPKRPRST